MDYNTRNTHVEHIKAILSRKEWGQTDADWLRTVKMNVASEQEVGLHPANVSRYHEFISTMLLVDVGQQHRKVCALESVKPFGTV
jgi:hypothetical protein